MFYLLSRILGGQGGLRSLFLITGWGFAPAVMKGVASSIAIGYALATTVAAPVRPEAIQTFTRTLHSNPAVIASNIVSVAIVFWQGLLWTFAVHYACNLSLRRAAIVVGIPLGIEISWSLMSLI